MKYCTNCGYEVKGKICNNCGSKEFEIIEEIEEAIIEEPKEEIEEVSEEPTEKLGILWITLGLLSPLAGWLAWAFLKETRPITAKLAAVAGTITFICNIILMH